MAANAAVRATLAVVRALQRSGIDYLVGGSLASSFHGIPRSTQDADLLIDLEPPKLPLLLEELEGTFYFDASRARDAVARGTSFNVIHLDTMFKVDLFVAGTDPLSQSEMRRRERHQIGESADESLFVASAEDTVLQKLHWYRLGNRVSERQWLDVVGILRVQGDRLDRTYLVSWASKLGLTDLLVEARERARDEP